MLAESCRVVQDSSVCSVNSFRELSAEPDLSAVGMNGGDRYITGVLVAPYEVYAVRRV